MAQAPHPDRTAVESDAAEATARILLETEAVLFRPDNPFTFTSGRLSPVYVDCRRLISFPRARRKLMDMGAKLIENRVGFESLDAIAGGETAGIPFAAWIADRLSLPMLYVRKQAKALAATPRSRASSGRRAGATGRGFGQRRHLEAQFCARSARLAANQPYVRDLQLRHRPAPDRASPPVYPALAAVGCLVAQKMGRFEPGQYEGAEFSRRPGNWP